MFAHEILMPNSNEMLALRRKTNNMSVSSESGGIASLYVFGFEKGKIESIKLAFMFLSHFTNTELFIC